MCTTDLAQFIQHTVRRWSAVQLWSSSASATSAAAAVWSDRSLSVFCSTRRPSIYIRALRIALPLGRSVGCRSVATPPRHRLVPVGRRSTRRPIARVCSAAATASRSISDGSSSEYSLQCSSAAAAVLAGNDDVLLQQPTARRSEMRTVYGGVTQCMWCVTS